MARHTHTRKVALLGLGLLCLGAALYGWPEARAPETEGTAELPLSEPLPPPATSALSPMPPPSHEVVPANAAQPVVVVSTPLAAGGETPDAISRPGTPLDSLRQRVMAANPDIAQFRQLQRKVLRKSTERDLLQDIYKDRELIETAKKDLLAEGERVFSDEAEFRRLYRVEYLGMGLEWKENPERPALLGDIEQLVRANNIHPEMDLELRRSLAGDKVELFMILLHNDRARADALLASVQGTRLEPLLAHARTRYDALWALAPKQ
ncbi:hypothetical protein ACLESD_19840 [Pyxidicoccus sp. 3LFB2]